MEPAFVPPPRERHALAGRSTRLDPLTHAVRRDLADVRLASRVFAPHYAAPIPRRVTRAIELRETTDAGEPALALLEQGAAFDLLELSGDRGWGIAPALGLVGYIDASALEPLD